MSDPVTTMDPVDPTDELLTAYLDGELPSDQRHEVENRLVTDREFRKRLQRMQGAWEMLEELPRTTVAEGFAQTTVAMVSLRASQELDVQQKSRWKRITGWVVGALAAVVMAALIGGGTVRFAQWLQYRRQLADLPVAQNLRALLVDVSPELLGRLQEDPQWREHIARGARTGEMDGTAPVPGLSQVPLPERAERIEALDELRRSQLARAWEQFSELSGEEQARLRARFAALRQQSGRDGLLDRMVEYTDWLQTLRQSEQARVHDAANDEQRIEIIHELIERQRLAWAESVAQRLDQATLDDLYQWCLDLAALRMGEYPLLRPEIHLLLEQLQRDFHWIDHSEDSPEAFLARLIAMPHLQRRLDFVEEVFGQRSAGIEPTLEELKALAQELPEPARRELEGLREDEQREVLLEWVQRAVVARDPVAMQFAQARDYWEIYQSDQISDADRERWELMSPEAFRIQLERRTRRGRGSGRPRRPDDGARRGGGQAGSPPEEARGEREPSGAGDESP